MPASSTSVFTPVTRATQFSQGPYIPRYGPFNNCNNTLCFTHNHGSYVYNKNTGYGTVGTTANGYLFRRRRL
jgi:hypothetical protein